MNKFTISALSLAMAMAFSAKADVLKITLADGEPVYFEVSKIQEMTFEEEMPSQGIAGSYAGTVTVAVGAMASYEAQIECAITENADGTINFTYPEYQIPATVMGDLTLGTVTIPNIPLDAATGSYVLDYASLGLSQHFKSSQGMDGDYTLGEGSVITITPNENGIAVTNPFKLGAMPFPLTATFTGVK